MYYYDLLPNVRGLFEHDSMCKVMPDSSSARSSSFLKKVEEGSFGQNLTCIYIIVCYLFTVYVYTVVSEHLPV